MKELTYKQMCNASPKELIQQMKLGNKWARVVLRTKIGGKLTRESIEGYFNNETLKAVWGD